jgi:site-specific recombinase XerC
VAPAPLVQLCDSLRYRRSLPNSCHGRNFSSWLRACKGSTLDDRRDLAIVLAFIDTGARLGEVSAITVEDVDLTEGIVRVIGKGQRTRYASSLGRLTRERVG